jgi:hypothetical protein
MTMNLSLPAATSGSLVMSFLSIYEKSLADYELMTVDGYYRFKI